MRLAAIACIVLAGARAHAQAPAAPPDPRTPDPATAASPEPAPSPAASPPPATVPQARDRTTGDRARAEELCAGRDPSCDWVGALSTLESASVLRALAARGYVIDPQPWGKVVGKVHVFNEEVFAEGTRFLKFFNHFHVTTQESTIRSEAVIAPGAAWDQRKIEETARRLRDPLWSSVVAVVPVQSATAGAVDALIVTRDIWSLRFNTTYTFQQGKLTNLLTSLSENNVLGRRDVLAAAVSMDQGAIAVGPLFIDKNVLGEHIDLRVRVDDIFNRDELTKHSRLRSEGTQSTITLARPLWSLATDWAASASFTHRFAIDRQFRNTQLRTYQFTDPTTLVTTTFPIEYDMQRWGANAHVTRQWGDAVKQQLSFGHDVDSVRPRPLADAPGDATARAAFVASVLPRSEVTSVPYVEYAAFTPRYRTLRNVGTFDLAEDARLGPELDVVLGYGLRLLGSDATFQRLSAAAGWTLPWARDGFVRASAAIAARHQDDRFIDNTATGLLRGATPAVADRVRFLAQATISTRWRETQNRFFTIGSDTGLRGYGINQFSGRRLVSLQVEARTLPYPIWVLRLGAVVFYDLGGADDSLRRLALHHDVGLGLRALIPQTSAQLARFDVAFPFGGLNRGTPQFILGFGSEF